MSKDNNRIYKNREEIPSGIENIEKWQMSRQHFVKGLLLLGAISQLPFLTSCNEDKKTVLKDYKFGDKLTENQLQILIDVQGVLFPNDGNGPGAEQVNAHLYLQWVISDERMDPSESEYIVNGLNWTNETAQEKFSKDFLKLNKEEKEDLIKIVSKEKWGESWLSVILTLIFEALHCDPQYVGNIDKTGWKWLNHNPGYPRPTKELLYDNIFTTVNTRKH